MIFIKYLTNVYKIRLNPFKALGVIRLCLICNLIYSFVVLGIWFIPGCTPQTPGELFGARIEESLSSCNCTTG